MEVTDKDLTDFALIKLSPPFSLLWNLSLIKLMEMADIVFMNTIMNITLIMSLGGSQDGH